MYPVQYTVQEEASARYSRDKEISLVVRSVDLCVDLAVDRTGSVDNNDDSLSVHVIGISYSFSTVDLVQIEQSSNQKIQRCGDSNLA